MLLIPLICVSGFTAWVVRFWTSQEPRRRNRYARFARREGVLICMQTTADRSKARELAKLLRDYGIEYSIVRAKPRFDNQHLNSAPIIGPFVANRGNITTFQDLVAARDHGYVHDLVFG